MKRQATEKEKIFAKHITDEGLVFRIHKELLQVSHKRDRKLNRKKGKRLVWAHGKRRIRISNEQVKVLHFICHQRNEESSRLWLWLHS